MNTINSLPLKHKMIYNHLLKDCHMKFLYSLLILITSISFGIGQKTFAKDIASIIYTKCSTCHRPGEIGPMAFTNYDEVKSWGGTIKYVTGNGIMPPWQPDPTYSHFREENYLTDTEIATISDWVDSGMPRGDTALEPDFPDFPEGSVLGEPDLVLEMEEAWLHEGNNEDDYRYFVLPTNLTEDKIIKAIEFRPGNSKIVHHALFFEDLTGEAAENDALTPEYGFSGFGSFTGGGIDQTLNQKQYPGYAPGQKPVLFPDGIGQRLSAGADLVMQVHYAPWPVDEFDQSKVNIFFMDDTEETLDREVLGQIMVPIQSIIGESFFIPANTIKTFHGKFDIPIDVSLISIAPHMHLLGKHWEVWAEKPDGERINLVKINDWDFNWQGTYNFNRFIVIPAGSTIHAVASYDNTTANPNNPNNPPQFVTWGEGTQDEMYYLPINFVLYKQGDEHVIFDDTTVSVEDMSESSIQALSIAPNPSSDYTLAKFNIDRGQPLSIEIYDMNGKKIRTIRKSEFYNIGQHFVNFSVKSLNTGMYFLKISGKDVSLSKKFLKQ